MMKRNDRLCRDLLVTLRKRLSLGPAASRFITLTVVFELSRGGHLLHKFL